MHTKKLLLTIIVYLIIFACKKDDIYVVPDIIQPYIDEFIAEAAERGINLQIDDLVVLFEENLEVDGTHAAGLCQFGSKKTSPTIKLDTTSVNWQSNASSRELLVFHELGHCVLDRGHVEDRLPNNNFTSVMRPSGEQLYGPVLSRFKREYYFDELFNATSPAPSWAVNVLEYNDISQSSKTLEAEELFDDASGGWSEGVSTNTSRNVTNGVYKLAVIQPGNYFVGNTLEIDNARDFEIEVNIKIAGDAFAGVLWGGNDRGELTPFFQSLFFDYEVTSIGSIEFGTESSYVFENIVTSGFNKITIRKSGFNYLFYINEERIDNMQFGNLNGDEFGISFGGQSGAEVQVADIKLYYVN